MLLRWCCGLPAHLIFDSQCALSSGQSVGCDVGKEESGKEAQTL